MAGLAVAAGIPVGIPAKVRLAQRRLSKTSEIQSTGRCQNTRVLWKELKHGRNHVAQLIKDAGYYNGDVTLLRQHHHHDVILANINRNILLQDLESYDEVLNTGGNIALSGFFTGDVPVLQKAIKTLGWACLE